MKQAVVYDADDIKTILAEKHGVDPKNVIRNQYSYTVVLKGKMQGADGEEGVHQ